MKHSIRHAIAIAALLGATVSTAAQAVEYNQVQPDKSRVTFAYKQMNVAMDGAFKKFSGQLSFDPAQPTKAKATIEVDLASIDTGSSESDGEVAGKAWFNTPAFPTARFESATVKALGGNRFEVAGKLTIKGKSRDVVVPATFSTQGNSGVFDGSLTIRRGDFSVGEGAWAAFDVVANDVQIKFHIAASAK